MRRSMAGGFAVWLVVTSFGRAQTPSPFPEAPVDNGASGVTLGRPVPLIAGQPADSGSRIVDERVARSSFQSPEPLPPITTTVAQSPPQGGIVPVQAPVAPVPGAAEQYN